MQERVFDCAKNRLFMQKPDDTSMMSGASSVQHGEPRTCLRKQAAERCRHKLLTTTRGMNSANTQNPWWLRACIKCCEEANGAAASTSPTLHCSEPIVALPVVHPCCEIREHMHSGPLARRQSCQVAALPSVLCSTARRHSTPNKICSSAQHRGRYAVQPLLTQRMRIG